MIRKISSFPNRRWAILGKFLRVQDADGINSFPREVTIYDGEGKAAT